MKETPGNFTHLHVHSCYSMLAGANRPHELADRGAALGQTALALTDTDGIHGMTSFIHECRRANIRPIVGTALTAQIPSKNRDEPRVPAPACGFRDYAVLLCESKSGYETMCELITARHCDDRFELDSALASANPDGLVLLSPSQRLLDTLSKSPRWSNRIYAEIVLTEFDAQRQHAARIADFSRAHGIPLAATTAAYSANGAPDEMKRHHTLRAMRELTTLQALRHGEVAQPSQKLLGAEDMQSRFYRYPEAVRNAAEIGERCRFVPDLGKWFFPTFPLPPGKSEWHHFHDLCIEGLKRRIPGADARYINQLEYEIRIITEGRFVPYFLILHDLMTWAHGQGMFTIGRGSAANSLAAYSLGITDVDPIRYELFFERFLNPERKSLPDIDIDFSWRDRDRVYEHVYNKFGHERVANVCTFITFQAKSGYREVAKVFGFSDAQITNLTKLISGMNGRNLERLQDPEYDPSPAFEVFREEPHRSIIEIAKGLTGFPTHLSVHCGGVVIAPTKLSHFLPVQRTVKEGIKITQLDMWGVEDIGLVKLDLLSLRALETVQQTMRDVNGSLAIDPQDVDAVYGDKPTRDRMRAAQTIGCFDIESPAMRELYQLTKCDTYDEATINTSVIRPGAAGTGAKEQYVRCRLGLDKASYILPELEPMLHKSYGKLIFQEQVMQVAHDIAGMSWAEADTFRRAMSGKERLHRGGELIAMALIDFRRRCAERGIAEDAVDKLAMELRSFAGYSFCKAHAAAFARVSGLAVYLKEHFPAEYMAAVLSNGSGIYYICSGPQTYVSEARRMGIEILPPDVNWSDDRWTAEGTNAIRVGLRSVFGLSETASETIVGERRTCKFTDAVDFLTRVHISDDEVRYLVDSGALDSIAGCGRQLNRNELHWLTQVKLATRSATVRENRVYAGVGTAAGTLNSHADGMFGSEGLAGYVVPELPCPKVRELRLAQYRALGFCVNTHPVELWRDEIERASARLRLRVNGKLKRPEAITHSRMGRYIGRNVIMSGYIIEGRRTMTKQGKRMRFMTLDQPEGVVNGVIWPEAYERIVAPGHCGEIAVVAGRVADNHGCLSVEIEDAETLELDT